MVKVSVVGATGYTGEELVKILAGHSGVEITTLSAIIDRPTKISAIIPNIKRWGNIVCKELNVDEVSAKSDCVFLALPHKVSMQFAPKFLEAGKTVIDLSADYRLPAKLYKEWYGTDQTDKTNLKKAVYGLPELYIDKIKKAKLLANPGCFPTSIILGAAPAVKEGLFDGDIIADSKTGVTGAGRKADVAIIFGEVNENMKPYKVNTHQHKPEINEILSSVSGDDLDIVFTPHLAPMSRGILSTIYLRLKKKISLHDITAKYERFYDKKPFVRILKNKLPQVRDVAGTNFCDIGLSITGRRLIVVSAIDNLIKGAAGQAVQNFNIMYGLKETEGLE